VPLGITVTVKPVVPMALRYHEVKPVVCGVRTQTGVRTKAVVKVTLAVVEEEVATVPVSSLLTAKF
jgi:hypothetical protein